MKIEWASSFGPDGSRRKPAPSSMHGWLAKMRGTLLGDEELRSKGMREMKDAKRWRKLLRDRQRRVKGHRTILSFLPFRLGKKAPSRASRGTRRANTLSRSSHSRRSSAKASASSSRSHRSKPSKGARHPGRRSARPPPARLSRR